ncbi:MAG: hypothetical protein WCR46_22800 [Deltaproteobacteria bacterium]
MLAKIDDSYILADSVKKAYTANRHNFTFLVPHPNPPPLGEGVYEKRRLCRFAVYILERQPPEYISRLTNSYLYGALEIAWRVSVDPEVVKGIAPDTPDAAPVVQWFINSK